jgi:hypothetical protein
LCLAAEEIEFQVADLQLDRRACTRIGAAHHVVQARAQFGEREGFAEVIVGARAKAFDAVVHVRQGGQQDRRHAIAGAA